MNDELTKAIASDLGIAELPLSEQQKIIGELGGVALKAATTAVIGKLADGKKEEFASLAQAGDPETLRSFLDREVPDHEHIAYTAVADEVKRFKALQGTTV